MVYCEVLFIAFISLSRKSFFSDAIQITWIVSYLVLTEKSSKKTEKSKKSYVVRYACTGQCLFQLGLSLVMCAQNGTINLIESKYLLTRFNRGTLFLTPLQLHGPTAAAQQFFPPVAHLHMAGSQLHLLQSAHLSQWQTPESDGKIDKLDAVPSHTITGQLTFAVTRIHLQVSSVE